MFADRPGRQGGARATPLLLSDVGVKLAMAKRPAEQTDEALPSAVPSLFAMSGFSNMQPIA